jgi:transposase InsO family protein
MGRVSDPRSDRQRRQLSFIAEFSTEIRHISGPSNVVADALSRPAPDPAADSCRRVEARPVVAGRCGPPSGPLAGSTPVVAAAGLRHHPGSSSPSAVAEQSSCAVAAAPPSAPAGVAAGSRAAEPPVDVRDIAAAQPACADCQRAASSPSLRVLEVDMSGHRLLVEVSSGVMRPLVPQQFRRAIFQAVHGLAHAGIRATKRMIASRYLWPNLAKDVADWCRSCQACQRAKVTAQPAAAVQPIAVPTLRFSHVHIDIVGPLPCSQDGFSYVLTAVDRSTRWAEALPLKGIAAADCAEVFIAGWVARYGVPSVVTSDRGVQFTSAFWAATMARLGVKHKLTTAFHPQANGAVERFHRRLKDSLRARLASSDWPQHLPWVMLGLRAAPREDSGLSAAELVFGAPLSLPGPVITTAEAPPEDFVQRLRAGVPCVAPLPPPSAAASSKPPSSLMAAAFVYVRAPPAAPGLSPMYRGPYEVVKRTSKYFIIKMGGRFDAVTVDRLKPHLGGPVVPAVPPRRGRPPKSGPVGEAALGTIVASTGGG